MYCQKYIIIIHQIFIYIDKIKSEFLLSIQNIIFIISNVLLGVIDNVFDV